MNNFEEERDGENEAPQEALSQVETAIEALKAFFGVGSSSSISAGVAGKLGGSVVGAGSSLLNVDTANGAAIFMLRTRIERSYGLGLIDFDTQLELKQRLGSDPADVLDRLERISGRHEEP